MRCSASVAWFCARLCEWEFFYLLIITTCSQQVIQEYMQQKEKSRMWQLLSLTFRFHAPDLKSVQCFSPILERFKCFAYILIAVSCYLPFPVTGNCWKCPACLCKNCLRHGLFHINRDVHSPRTTQVIGSHPKYGITRSLKILLFYQKLILTKKSWALY